MTYDNYENSDLVIVYDGKCFFCENYIRFQKLKDNLGSIALLDARTHPKVVALMSELGMDINQGMAARYKDKWYFGAECMALISSLSDKNTSAGKVWNLLFRNSKITALLYPMFKTIRNCVLAIRRVGKIKN